jgi:hypothetical protein
MKIGPRVFAVLAFGAVSTQAAVAGHHGHHASAAAASHSGTDAQSPGPAVQGSVVDDVGAESKKSAKTGAATDAATKSAPTLPHGLQRPGTPALGSSGKPGDAGAEIDIRITVHQGHETIKGKDRLFKKSKTATAPGIGLKHEPVHIVHPKSPVGPDAGPHRNPVGTKVVKHDKKAAPGKTAVAAPPQPGGVTHEPDKSDNKVVTGNAAAPTKTSSPAGAAAGAALKTATANGPSVGGTGTARPGSATVALGGPPKIAAGVLSGNSFRPKHP